LTMLYAPLDFHRRYAPRILAAVAARFVFVAGKIVPVCLRSGENRSTFTLGPNSSI
jgi:hypothetical protein